MQKQKIIVIIDVSIFIERGKSMKKMSEIIVHKRKIIFIIYVFAVALSIFGIFNCSINYDMSKYLPDDSSVRKGMEIMSDEFGDSTSITVMFDGLDETEQLKRKEELSAIKNVHAVLYDQNDEKYYRDGHSKYMVNVSAGTYSDDAQEVLSEIKDTYGDDAYVCGPVVDNGMVSNSLGSDMPIISAIAVVVIFTILFTLCDSWLEPVIFMGCIGVAIILNMGTNALLPSISNMTFSIGALLQLGLSMDYSIMLINRYAQEKKKYSSHEEAMINALSNSFATISGSSVTTIVGLLALVFMDFKIGQDMGVVLAKGVFMSLICIFTLLPGVVVTFDRAIEKSRKRSLEIPMAGAMKLVTRLGLLILPAVMILVGVAFVEKDDIKVSYTKTFDNKDQTYIEECFGLDNQTVLIYDKNEDPEKVSAYIEWLEKRSDINSVQDYSNTIGIPYTPAEIAAQFGVEQSQVEMMFQLAGKETMSTPEFLNAASALLEKMPGSEEKLAQLKAAKAIVNQNVSQMVGKEHNRMIVSVKHPAEGKDSFKAIGELIDEADNTFENSHYYVGDSVMGKEMDDGFKDELNFVTILTVIAIFLVVIVTFRSVLSSALLVIVIQSSIYITMFLIARAGFTVNYISLILVQCILMGATIDYGILYTCNYIEERGNNDKKHSVGAAMNRSVKTILTSSLILFSTGVITGLLMTQKATSEACAAVACGTAVSVIMVIFILPVIIYLTDKLAIKQFGKKKNDNAKGKK